MSTESHSENSWLKQNSIVLILCVIAFWLRLLNLDYDSLWMDEIYSLMVTNGHLYPDALDNQVHTAAEMYNRYVAWQPFDWEILIAILKDNMHLPLYYVLLNPWLSVFGISEVALRSFSAVVSFLMLLPIYWLGRDVIGKKAALWTLLVVALSPCLLYFAQEGRMYALSLTWSTLSGLCLWKAIYSDNHKRWAALYTLSLLCGLMTHYAFLFQLVFHGVFVLLNVLRQRDNRYFVFLYSLVAVILLVVAWYPVFEAQRSSTMHALEHFSDGIFPIWRYLWMYLWEPFTVVAWGNNYARVFYIPLVSVSMAMLLFQVLRRFELKTHGFILLWILIPLTTQIILDHIQGSHSTTIVRYSMLIAPAVYLMVGMSLDKLIPEKKLKPAASFIALVALVIGIGTVTPSPLRYKQKFPTRPMAEYIAEQNDSADLVVVNGPLGAPATIAYYLAPIDSEQPILYWSKVYKDNQTRELPVKGVLAPYTSVWFYRYRGTEARGNKEIAGFLDELYPQKEVGVDPTGRLTRYTR